MTVTPWYDEKVWRSKSDIPQAAWVSPWTDRQQLVERWLVDFYADLKSGEAYLAIKARRERDPESFTMLMTLIGVHEGNVNLVKRRALYWRYADGESL